MTISTSWQTPYHNILYIQFCGKWTWFEFHQVGQNIRQQVKAQSGRVDMIVDMRNATTAPVHNDNHTLRRMLETMPGNHGVMVFAGADKFTEMLLGILKNTAPVVDRKVMMAHSPQEALMMIAERRDTVKPARSS